jgi:exopolysaccharide production protein ExoZ
MHRKISVKKFQLQNIQILRGIAAIMVVIGHSLGRVQEISEYLHFSNGLDIKLPTGFGVDLFFVISGFIIFVSTEKTRTQNDARKYFIFRRSIRIVPIYWICTTVFLFISLAKNLIGLNIYSFDALYIVASYFFIPYRPMGDLRPIAFPIFDLGWTLNYEVYFYVIYSLFFLKNKYLSVFFVFFVMITMVIMGNVLNYDTVQLNVWSRPIIIEFIFGIVIGIIYCKGYKLSIYICIFLIFLSIILVFFHPFGSPPMLSGTHLNGFSRVSLWGLPAAIIVLAASLGPTFRPSYLFSKLNYLGDASYSIYLFHPFGLMISTMVFKKIILLSEDHLITILLSSILFSITFAIYFYRFVEKPLTDYLNSKLPTKNNKI